MSVAMMVVGRDVEDGVCFVATVGVQVVGCTSGESCTVKWLRIGLRFVL